MSVDQQISFRLLQRNDLMLLHNWLCSDHVFTWYQDAPVKPTMVEVKQKYLPRILGESKTTCYIILVGSEPVGQIQMYKISDYPEYQKNIQITENAAGIDLFIGEISYQHKGLGSSIMKKFLAEYVFPKLAVDSCIISPSVKNTSAIKAYKKVGFKYIKTAFDGHEDVYLMRIDKQDIT